MTQGAGARVDGLDRSLLERLRAVDTPTVCNAIEVAQGRRGFDAFTRGTFVASDPEAPAIVGFARTATIRGARPSGEPREVIRDRRMAYFRAMATGPHPTVAVIEDLDHPDCVGAWWGEVHTAVHKAFGMAGAVTNGLVRDLGSLVDGFPVIAGGTGVSHGFVHVVEIGTPVSVHGLSVREGDLIHADRHGALVIPEALAPSLPEAIDKLEASEELVLGPAGRGELSFEAFEAAWQQFEKART